ncbi:uncharacterized protein LOC124137987 isoform X2 [Haliotis rufescens]|uniref:uncharacterized protein LOC124137987 isoform X2 n=1 Tax=Haliotis rufescens TaxID=6454 RepID=UPI00201F451D|nr:uncharacterized protein LOC124137987 isoform X2 [Haliotis rufescens]
MLRGTYNKCFKISDKPELVYKKVDLPEDSKHKLAFVLENVLSPEECQWFIEKTEKKGYKRALIKLGGGQEVAHEVRNSSRYMWDSRKVSKKLWSRVKTYVPEVFKGRRALGLNERLRFLRYEPGEYFRIHKDGIYTRKNMERSYITVQMYLNEGFQGGCTTFFSSDALQKVPVVPKKGSALIFQHDILHEGSEVMEGLKYAIRTDVMYSAERLTDSPEFSEDEVNSQT